MTDEPGVDEAAEQVAAYADRYTAYQNGDSDTDPGDPPTRAMHVLARIAGRSDGSPPHGLCPNHPRGVRVRVLDNGDTRRELYCRTCEDFGAAALLRVSVVEPWDVPGVPGATRLRCPISTCLWYWDQPDDSVPTAFQSAPGQPFSVAGFAAAQCREAEAVIRPHLETHTLLDWVQEVSSRRSENAAVAAKLNQARAAAQSVREAFELAGI